MKRFLQKYGEFIEGVLHGFDRIILKLSAKSFKERRYEAFNPLKDFKLRVHKTVTKHLELFAIELLTMVRMFSLEF
ncbi:MAG: hypothetical protein D6813_06690 [Calditrichaeota bacterium]|nr:MAG: hypothetical protein D6813_06690 [Calditrichota bacterium]